MNLPPLWEHQRRALAFMEQTSPATYLGMEMGTGKSRVMVEHIERKGWKRILILCPKKVINVWPREFNRYAQGAYEFYPARRGTIKERAKYAASFFQFTTPHARVMIVNHEACWREQLGDWILGQQWDVTICDESHRAKDHSGKFGQFMMYLSQRSDYRYCLSGTPEPHTQEDCTTGRRIPDPLDLFAQYRFLRPSLFGTRFHPFKQQLCRTQTITPRGGGRSFDKIIGFHPDALADFYKRRAVIMFELMKGEAPELPPQLDMVRTTPMEGSLARAYHQMAKDFYLELDRGEVTAKNILSKTMKLRQICSGYLTPDGEDKTIAQAIHNDKLDLLAELLEDIPKPVIVVAHFTYDLLQIQALTTKLGYQYGEISGRNDDLLSDATMPPHLDVMGVQAKSGGVGVDLSRSCNTIFYSCDYNWAEHYQMRKRTHRSPQTKPCSYYYLIVENSIDQIIYDGLTSRESMDGDKLMTIMADQRARQLALGLARSDGLEEM